MADVTTTEQIVREAPDIEAYKLGLLDLAKKRAEIAVNIPNVTVAGQTPEQIEATRLASQGIGSYQPFLNTASSLYGQAAQGYGAVPSYGTAGIGAVRAGGNTAFDMSMQGIDAVRRGSELANLYGSQGVNALQEGSSLANQYAAAGSQAYNPNAVQQYMNPYQQLVTQEATKEMARQAAIQQAQNQAQSVRAGAFGGSRQGVQTSELARNLADIQSKRIFEDYSTNYSQAQTAAMNAFQNQQARLQQAGSTALGASTALGQANISAGQMALSGGTSLGAQNQSAGNTALQAGTALGQANISGGQLAQGASAGLGGLGTSTANLGQLTSGLGQGDVSFLYNLGSQNLAYNQKVADAARANQLQAQYEPFQRISFLSDIYKGAPSSQQTISQATSPSPSILSQAGGLGIAGLAAYNLFGKSGAASAVGG